LIERETYVELINLLTIVHRTIQWWQNPWLKGDISVIRLDKRQDATIPQFYS